MDNSNARENLIGMGLMTLAMGMFALEDALIKYLAKALPVGEIMILIGIGGTSVFWAIAKYAGDRFEREIILHPAIIARTISELCGTACFVLSLALVPLSLISAMIQVNPLIVTLGAALFLGERVGVFRWTAILIGLLGVIIILRPTGADFNPAVIFTILGVLGLSARDLATRRVPKHASTYVMATLGFAATIPAGLILMIFADAWVMPTLTHILIIVGGVCIGVIAYYAIITAMRVGEVAAVTPFRYSRLIFGVAAGMAFFGETLDFYTILGGLIIVTAGLYSLWRENRLR